MGKPQRAPGVGVGTGSGQESGLRSILRVQEAFGIFCVSQCWEHIFLGLHHSPAILGTLTQPLEHCDND